MASLADQMKRIDALIFDKIGEVMVIGGTEVPGIFMRRYHEVTMRDGTVEGVALSFDCQYSDDVGDLEEGDTVGIKIGDVTTSYIFLRRIPNRGDETSRVIVELGTP